MAILFTRLRDSEARTVQFLLGRTTTDFRVGTVFTDNQPEDQPGTTVVEVSVPDALIKGGLVVDSVDVVVDVKGNPVDKVPGHTLTLEVVDGLPFADSVRLPFRSTLL
jgi:hypothetical protein